MLNGTLLWLKNELERGELLNVAFVSLEMIGSVKMPVTVVCCLDLQILGILAFFFLLKADRDTALKKYHRLVTLMNINVKST